MIDTKREIILEEGIPVKVYDKEDLLCETVALVGKATKQFASEVSLESHRQGQFLPEVEIRNGLTIKNEIAGEDYLIIANYTEVIDRQLCATITRMVVCNSKMTVRRMVEEADDRGKITKSFKEIYSNLSVYVEPIDSDIKQLEPGKAPIFIYKVYAPNILLDIEDQILIDVNGVKTPFKLTGYDYLTFPGLTILGIITETRR